MMDGIGVPWIARLPKSTSILVFAGAFAARTAMADPPPSTVATTPAARTRVAIYNLRAEPALAALAQEITDEILLHLGRQRDLITIGETEIQLLLTHARDASVLEACGGHDTCLAKVTQAADAEKQITGHLARLGESYYVTLSLADVEQVVVERGEGCEAESREDLASAVTAAVDRLLGRGGEPPKTFALSIAVEGTKVAVLNLEAYDEGERRLADTLTQQLSLELKRIDGLSVISRGEIEQMIDYSIDRAQCTGDMDLSCLVRIGGALGVDYLVSGGIGKLDDTFVLHLKLLDIKDAEVVHRVSESYRGPETQLAYAVRFATWKLLGREGSGSGSLEILANAGDSQVSIDGGDALPASGVFQNLKVGKHALSISAPDHYALHEETYVEPDQLTKVHVSLEELPTPWHQKWWVWTVAGTAIAAAVTTSVILATSAPDNGDVSVTVSSGASAR